MRPSPENTMTTLSDDARRRDHFARYVRRPQRLAVRVEREHVALVGADDDQRFARHPDPADSARPALTRQTARPVAASSRISVPSAAAA